MAKQFLQALNRGYQLGSQAGHLGDLCFEGGLLPVGALLQFFPRRIEVRHGR